MTAYEERVGVWSAEPGLALWSTRAREHSGDWRARVAQVLEGVREAAATPGGVGPDRARPRQ